MIRISRRATVMLGLASVLLLPGGAAANHSWGGYHWARTSNPFTLRLGDSVSATWDPYLRTTSTDWNKSSLLDTKIVTGTGMPRKCQPAPGQVEVCSALYGDTGWLGLASIAIADGTHIAHGSVQLNDTYFNTAQYNKPAWRNLVMCQEVGHILGLGHRDENTTNANLGTCMDYTNQPATNQHPNTHDRNQLAAIYSHLDSMTTVGQPAASAGSRGDAAAARTNAAGSWGRRVASAHGGRTSIYVRDLGAGNSVVTFVIWASSTSLAGGASVR